MKFENFVVNKENAFAFTALQAISDGSKIYNPIYIHSESGCGKTHLVNAATEEMAKKSLQTKIISGAELLDSLLGFLKEKRVCSIVEFYERFQEENTIVIEDIQRIQGMEATQEMLLGLIKYLVEQEKQVILTADIPLEKLCALDRGFRREFEWGLIADIARPGKALKYQIVQKKVEIKGIDISEKMKRKIAKMAKSVNQIEGILQQIKFYDNVEGRRKSGKKIKDKTVIRALEPRA